MPSSPPAANGSPDVPVALIDDHTLVRKGLVEVINGLGGYKVVLEAAHGLDYKEKVNGGPRIELAIVDLNMPVMDGYQTLDWIAPPAPKHARWPSPSTAPTMPSYARCGAAHAASCSRTWNPMT